MGCCQSRVASESPYAASNAAGSQSNLPNDSSRAAINRPVQNLDVSQDGARTSSVAGLSRKADGAIVRPNKPLQPPVSVRHSPRTFSYHQPPWTRRILEQQRKEFFDTRTANRREVWNALEMAAESIRQGDLAQAQAIMEAANVTCPTGRFARGKGKDRQQEGVYDDRGKLYDIPYWVVADPEDIIEGGDEKEIDGAEEEEELAELDQTIRGEKGKGRAEDIGEELRVTARLNTAKDVTVIVGSKQTVAVVKRKIETQNGIRLKRLIHLGKVLESSQTLDSAGWKPGQVLNAFVDETATNAVPQT
ncbi:Putative Ubiquitin domain-containing protein 1/2 [Septoria linicola]|uniref:Ubiquitin domain-containing protein 1/2 n=1 Tax=Septoria linicola TaxID=215465 RepID=A0A9Q9ADW1_9PEZI|nr:putative Ubiquitin domain-containing protein 1/2 [Septoria linicola]USW47152.1 Putative Ubiquitin domain-containing protein 1/2 [Septoria linicola]